MKLRIVYAVRAAARGADRCWLRDTCAGGAWTSNEWHAMTWPTPEEAAEALAAAELNEYAGGYSPLEIVTLVELAEVSG